ncbi:MAG TPA: hypothetical protein VER55_09630, partial [Ardenticatenaceae bacterium]|nr:hypothetical protein [Ardenticatenaceae bacterium]
MSSLWAVMRTEMRLTWRRYTFWVVQAIWLLPLALTYVSNLPNARSLVGASYVSLQFGTLTMWLLLLPLVVGPALTRDLGEPGEILWTTPLDGAAHLLGVALGLLLALLPALLAHLAAQWLVGYALVGWPAILFWRYGPPLFVASTVAGIGVAVVLALLLRRTLLLLLVWVALWAGVMRASLDSLGPFESAGLASPANVFFHTLQFSPTLGLGLARPLAQGLVAWFIGLGVLATLFGVGAALLADRRRLVRPGVSLASWIVVAGLLAGGGWLLHARAVRAQAILPSPADIQPGHWRVEAHILDVSVDAERDTLTGTSTLRLVSARAGEEAEVVLRLNPGLMLAEARDETGQSLHWQRVGDSLVIALPAPAAEPLTLQLHWQGALRLPYTDYAQLGGSPAPAFDSSQPVRALLSGGVGYLFRDGD